MGRGTKDEQMKQRNAFFMAVVLIFLAVSLATERQATPVRDSIFQHRVQHRTSSMTAISPGRVDSYRVYESAAISLKAIHLVAFGNSSWSCGCQIDGGGLRFEPAQAPSFQ
jgi:hypothetical protein